MVVSVKAPSSFASLVGQEAKPPSHPKSLVEFAYEQLLSMLITMKIRPGSHISIEAVARDFQISQTPIREALTLLEAQKLAAKIPNVGFRAAELLTPKEIDDLFDLRLLIEPRAAALAAENSDEIGFKAIQQLANDMAAAASGIDVDYAHFAGGDAKLHQLVANASGNRFIAETIEGLHVHLHIFRYLFETNAPAEAVKEHADILAALLSRDAKAAEAAMKRHLTASRVRMDRALDKQERLVAAAASGEIRGRAKRGRRPTQGV